MSFLLIGLSLVAFTWCVLTFLLPLFGYLLMLKDSMKRKLSPSSDAVSRAIIQTHRGE